MARIYDQADWQGTMEIDYHKRPFYALRAAAIKAAFPSLSASSKILVAGCGYGYLLEELFALGLTGSYGCDGSTYAMTTGKLGVSNTVQLRLQQKNILVPNDMRDMRQFAGLQGQNKFDLVITEDVLPCFTASEVPTALANLRATGTNVAHIISCWEEFAYTTKLGDGSIVMNVNGVLVRMPGLLWLTRPEWRTQVGQGEIIWAAGQYNQPLA